MVQWEALPRRSPPNGCLCVVLVADLRVGGAAGADLQPAVPLTGFSDWLLACCVFQVIVQSGRQPSVLQKLCQLPFQYFSHPRLIRVLFPTLISACYNNSHNKAILQQEMSCVLLATFIQVKKKKKNRKSHAMLSDVFRQKLTDNIFTQPAVDSEHLVFK